MDVVSFTKFVQLLTLTHFIERSTSIPNAFALKQSGKIHLRQNISLISKCHNLKMQTNPRHREKETYNTDSHSKK